MNLEEKEYQERYKMLKEKFQGITGMELIRLANADKNDNDAFDELIRRFIRNIKSVYIPNYDGYKDHATTSTQVQLTAFQECILNPDLLEEVANEAPGLDLEKDEDLGMVISNVVGKLAPNIYQTIVDYRKLSDDELNNLKEADDALASFVLSERMYQRVKQETQQKEQEKEMPKITRRIVKNNTLCLGGRLFTDEYVETVEQDGRVVKHTKTQLKPEVSEFFKSAKCVKCL